MEPRLEENDKGALTPALRHVILLPLLLLLLLFCFARVKSLTPSGEATLEVGAAATSSQPGGNTPAARKLLSNQAIGNAYLASEAIDALNRFGYTTSASFLQASGILLNLQAPATFLAPNNFAYNNISINGSAAMALHTLATYQTYKQFRRAVPTTYSTYSSGTFVTGMMFNYSLARGFRSYFGFQVVGSNAMTLVNHRDLFVNSLVSIQGVTGVLQAGAIQTNGTADLASQAINALNSLGYTITASFLQASGILSNTKSPVTFLAPNNSAYINVSVNGVAAMALHTLATYQTYKQFRRAVPATYSTLSSGTFVMGMMFNYTLPRGNRSYFGFQVAGAQNMTLVNHPDLFVNALVSIQGVTRIL